MDEYPRWVYPDAPATTRGVLLQSDEEEAAYRADCARQDAADEPADEPADAPKNRVGRPRKPA